MTEYQARVYEIVSRIPEGRVATYGLIAALLGNPQAARRVGQAMANAPWGSGLPCHRVVNSKGEMLPGNQFGGPDAQRSRLEQEGVVFRPSGRIDLRVSLWTME